MNVELLKDIASVESVYEMDPAKRYVIQFKYDLTDKQHERIMELIRSQWPGFDIAVVGHQVRLYERLED